VESQQSALDPQRAFALSSHRAGGARRDLLSSAMPLACRCMCLTVRRGVRCIQLATCARATCTDTKLLFLHVLGRYCYQQSNRLWRHHAPGMPCCSADLTLSLTTCQHQLPHQDDSEGMRRTGRHNCTWWHEPNLTALGLTPPWQQPRLAVAVSGHITTLP
jgi:hypothetical protein